MSQGQPTRSEGEQQTLKYSDVFQVSGELAHEPVAPRDAAAAQAAESIAFGQIQKGGPAAVMQSAADANLRRGVVGRDDATDAARQHGVTISEDDVGGEQVITETVGGEVVGRYVVAGQGETTDPPLSAISPAAVTVREALESAVRSAGDKPVDESTAAAIQAVESRATGKNQVLPGGVASAAQSAAKHNARTVAEHKKIKLRDVLAGTAAKLPDDMVVTKEDADAAVAAELRNKLDMSTQPGGVAASMVAAAKLNQQP